MERHIDANELAYFIQNMDWNRPFANFAKVDKAATMLRQLQAENEALKTALENLEVFVRTEHLCGPRTNKLLKEARQALNIKDMNDDTTH